jgi:hypothetical protein
VEKRSTLRFDGHGCLIGDREMTLSELKESELVTGPNPLPAGWDKEWRRVLVDNLEILVRQLWTLGMTEIWIGGSFASNSPHPGDIDGYFICSLEEFRSRGLPALLNALDRKQSWGWRRSDARLDPQSQKHKLLLWHNYRVELYPEYTELPHWAGFFRTLRGKTKPCRGMIQDSSGEPE